MTNEKVLDNDDFLVATLECLRASAGIQRYEEMSEIGLTTSIQAEIDRLQTAHDAVTRHNIYCNIAAASYIMAMRLDHVERIYDNQE